MKPRKSTAILMGSWVATFVLYLFVKPDTPTPPAPLVNTVPAAVHTTPAAP
ncbi:hypothetical protein GV791_24700 [Nocardia cyriacigeorgica]|nr:hypothetical protein [Nocardia cyriacigeorgica]MBF6081387.1 hypothetical protein [Nocardia cyriacigeorgica]MBF6288578.1 hypothetical protein [Nocardia cyriacigeorgica]MBF6424231.1 hypothetical protein [Nocardia cyriacigeorgica]NEW35741.1 hypothetical protein [Nocardia cyriacigeorgica]BDT88603.1 hypothetical protein FMUAM8_43670 [Nocardia cyriacigeorgica]